jgi:stage II sporulation protein R
MMQNQTSQYKLWVTIALVLLCAAHLFTIFPESQADRSIGDFWQVHANDPGLLRLHVVANSNLPSDQLFKSKLVDEVQRLLADSGAQWAVGEPAFIDANLPLLQDELQQFASLSGHPASEIRVTLARAEFPLRAYGRDVYPPGEYLSLNVLVGAGAGDNWWCLLFPPLCLPMAEAQSALDCEPSADETNPQAQTPADRQKSQKSSSGWRFKISEQWGGWFRSN